MSTPLFSPLSHPSLSRRRQAPYHSRMPIASWARCARVFHLSLWLSASALSACSDGEHSNQGEELSDSVSFTVGKDGATVKAKGVSLVIPEGALDKEVTITAKSTDKAVPQGKEAISQVYEFGPAGTKFKKDVDVIFNTDKPEHADKAAVYFTKEDDPSVFEKLASTVSTDKKQVSAKVKHFSLGFAGLDLASAGEPDGGGIGAAPDMDAGGSPLFDGGTSVESDARAEEADAAPQVHHIRVQSKDSYGVFVNQTWGAYQDGDGAWQVLPTPSDTGVYEFDVISDRYAVALVCATADDSRSDGVIRYEPSTTTSIDIAPTTFCHTEEPNVVEHTLSGVFSNLPVNATYYLYGHAYGVDGPPLAVGTGMPPFTIANLRHNEPLDVLVAVTDGSTSYLSGWILRDQALNQDVTGQTLNGEADPNLIANFGLSTVNIENATADTHAYSMYTMGGATQGLPLNAGTAEGTTTRIQPYHTVPASERRASDRYRFSISETLVGTYRSVDRYSQAGGDLVVTMPDYYAPLLGSTPTPYKRPRYVFEDEPVLHYAYGFSYLLAGQEGSHFFRGVINPAWLPDEAQHSVEFPDFSSLAGFNPAWFAPSGAEVEFFGEVTKLTTSADGTETTVSKRSITFAD